MTTAFRRPQHTARGRKFINAAHARLDAMNRAREACPHHSAAEIGDAFQLLDIEATGARYTRTYADMSIRPSAPDAYEAAVAAYRAATARLLSTVPALAPFHWLCIMCEVTMAPPHRTDADERLRDAFALNATCEAWWAIIRRARATARSTEASVATNLMSFAGDLERHLDHLAHEGRPSVEVEAWLDRIVAGEAPPPQPIETPLSRQLARLLADGPTSRSVLLRRLELRRESRYAAEVVLALIVRRRSDSFTSLEGDEYALRGTIGDPQDGAIDPGKPAAAALRQWTRG